eukprot:CCRYP_008382-RA/>CCRYP_008382-RA protein AED:0.41 eAED:0.41 QI:151/1/1/1/0/0/2/69/55
MFAFLLFRCTLRLCDQGNENSYAEGVGVNLHHVTSFDDFTLGLATALFCRIIPHC